jgi:hypothetical protein
MPDMSISPVDIEFEEPHLIGEVLELHGKRDDMLYNEAKDCLKTADDLYHQIDLYSQLRQKVIKYARDNEISDDTSLSEFMELGESSEIESLLEKIKEFNDEDFFSSENKLDDLKTSLKTLEDRIQNKVNINMQALHPVLLEMQQLLKMVSDTVKSVGKLLEDIINRGSR